ncbi:MAG: DAK2 domain-containing protein [Clostridia bacterium]|nr:DAK2 domain-containing protein [Clostridia bacterium]
MNEEIKNGENTAEEICTAATLDGDTYRDMITSAAYALDNDKEEINNLNVFPVPDGDTGINMSLTMSPAREELKSFSGNVSEVSSEVAKTFLRAARGNSGVILSSFFRGMAKGLKDCVEADTKTIASAFKNGVDMAYKAVMTPTEGTILTVMRACAETAIERMDADPDAFGNLDELFSTMLEVAGETLAKTPDMLPQLKQANVVDAGGSGFVAVLQGMLAALRHHPVQPKDPSAVSTVRKQADFTQFATEDITFPYCTECIVNKYKEFEGEEKCEELHSFVIGMGDSVVFVEDYDIVKIHVHTDDPGKVLSEAVKYGSFYTVKIENMKNQHTGLIATHEDSAEESDGIVFVPAEKKYGFVTVCSGAGIKSVFTDLGADKIVTGGQTMNPSTDDMLKAICATPAEVVFVLPNNKNIFLAAKTAAELVEDKRVEVINTVSIPQGVSAMFAFDEDATPEENREAMEARIADTKTASITYAAHDSTFDGKKIRLGQMLGLVENKVKFVTDTREECLALIADTVKKSSIITVYYGEDVTKEEAEKAVDIIAETINPYADITLVDGGQPVYAYIISGENE